jgi:hypothetical protein
MPYAFNYGYQLAPTQYTAAAAPQPIFTIPYSQPAPVQAAPVPTTYVQPAPVQSAYVQATPVQAAYIPPAPVPAVQAAPLPASYIQAAPIAPATAPVALASQYSSQDEAGQYSFGYTDGSSDRQEVKTLDGVVRGAYQYVDTNGVIQTVEYIADNDGFRVAGTNLPVHVALPPVDTPEVVAAKAQHALLYNQAAAEAALQPAEEEAAEGSGVLEVADEPLTYFGAAAAQPLPVVPVQTFTGAIPAASPVVAAIPAAAAIPYGAASGSQYHAQDELGQYNYGYSDLNSAKQEVKTADGVVRGSYSYLDSDGLVQTVNYIADALGFRVGATNLPVHVIPGAENQAAVADTEAVAAASQPVVAAYNSPTPVLAPQVSYTYFPYASSYAYNIPVSAAQPYIPQPVAAAAAPAVAVAPAVAAAAPAVVPTTANDAVSSQYHAQDELGQYNYGYASPTQTKSEVKTADGIVRGAYSYVDPNGLVQTVNYISDAMGFRVAATNLPVHAVEGTAEPAAAATPAVEEAKLRSAHTLLTPQVAYALLPYAQSYGYNTPAAISA